VHADCFLWEATFEALRILDNEVYHMENALLNVPEIELWNEAINSKWGPPEKRRKWVAEDFDQLLGNCTVRLTIAQHIF
jgi:hypothetical protein